MIFPASPVSPWIRRVFVGLLLLPCLTVPIVVTVLTVPAKVEYTLTANSLVMEARLGPVDTGKTIARGDVLGAAPVTLSDGWRMAGTGRGDLCSGRFRYPDLGDVWQATTCGSDAVRIDTTDGIVVVAPADRASFISALTTNDGTSTTWSAASSTDRSGASLWLLPLAVVFVLCVVTINMFARGFKSLSYSIVDGVLIVPAHFRSVRIRLVDATVERRALKRAVRVAGTSLPGFNLGYFWSDAGRHHVAATNTTGGVLVRGSSTAYVTPADVDGFLMATAAAGARIV